MASDAASDIFAMLTPTQASPDALASAPAAASDAPAGVGESEIFAHSETPPSYSHGGRQHGGWLRRLCRFRMSKCGGRDACTGPMGLSGVLANARTVVL